MVEILLALIAIILFLNLLVNATAGDKRAAGHNRLVFLVRDMRERIGRKLRGKNG